VAALMGVKPDYGDLRNLHHRRGAGHHRRHMYASNYGTGAAHHGLPAGAEAFTAAVFGGIGKPRGAGGGRLLLGLIESIGSGYLGSSRRRAGQPLLRHFRLHRADRDPHLAALPACSGERVADRA
jgi:hypothetical protein